METGTSLYWQNAHGNVFEFEAGTKGGEYAWYRDLRTDESVRLNVKSLKAVSDAAVLAMARAEVLS